MKVLVVGATGATGRLLVGQLLDRGHSVKAIVRAASTLPEVLRSRENLSVVEASILDLRDAEMVQQVSGCDAVASCLGHKLSATGLFGHPRRLVTDATRRLCDAIGSNRAGDPVKFVLMNTAGNSNRDIDEPISFRERIVIRLLRLLLPPHVDNENAADYLRTEIGQDQEAVEWCVVRPDNLTNEETVTKYEVHCSPTRSAIFDAGQTSRINVADFMANLITDKSTWDEWRGRMPVLYNATPE